MKAMTARNAPCPCGSGKKFKRCHGRHARTTRTAAPDPRHAAEEARGLAARGRLDDAIALARQLPDGPARSGLLSGLYIARWGAGDDARARKLLARWRRLDPDHPEPWQRLVELHLREPHARAARKALGTLRARAPDAAPTHYYTGILAQLRGDLDAAMSAYRRCAEVESPLPLTDAERELEAAIKLLATEAGEYPGSPGRDEAMLARSPDVFGRVCAALDQWQAGWSRQPTPLTPPQVTRYSFARYNLGCEGMAGLTDVAQTLAQFEAALAIDPDHEAARVNHAFVLNYAEDLAPDDIARRHLELGRWYRGRLGPPARPARDDADPGRPLRVAYLSSDFRRHSVAHFIVPVLEHHDRSAVEVFAYDTGAPADEITERVRRAVTRFREVTELDDEALLQRIADDRIDILVDLNGLTRGHRLGVLARRAAPVQATWIGYPNTTGLDTVDYRIVDRLTDPPDAAAGPHSERLVRLPRTFSVYDPLGPMPDVAPPPGERRGHVTFGSFNHLRKLGDGVLRAWSDILARVPGARLLIKNVSLDLEPAAERLRAALEAAGIDAERVTLVGRTVERDAHLACYHEVDVALDSFPYNGTTTTCETLYMGVPVVSLAGAEHRARVGLSQLSALGLRELVADDVPGYVERAVQLAQDPERRAALRAGLRERLRGSALMDAAGFTAELEARYRELWAAGAR